MPINATQVADLFASAARESFSEGLRKIRHCVDQLTGDQLWWRPRPEMNSIANLMLHLAGNVRQWIVAGVGGAKDARDRPREFLDRSNRPKAELLCILEAAVRDADAVIATLTAEQLVSPRRIQGFDETAVSATMNCARHFHGHVQEIIHMTREQLGEQYEFDFVPRDLEQKSAAVTTPGTQCAG